MRTLALALPLLALTACGGSGSVSYGTPTAPSGSQMQAVTSLTDVGTHISVAAKGMSDANKAFEVHSLMASLQGTAVSSSGGAQGLDFLPEDIDAACTTGTAATGFTYNNCTLGNNGGTLSGSVKITTTSVAYDLTVAVASSGTTTKLTLKGTVNYVAGHVTGDLEYKIHISLPSGLGGLGGLGGSVANTDITTKAIFDYTYTETPACITGGDIEVTVDYAGKLHGAKFLFSGCNMLTVQNG